MAQVHRPRPRSRLAADLLHALLVQGATGPTQDLLARAVGVSARTVASAMSYLRDEELVTTSPLAFGKRWGYVLGIALGARSCRAGLVDVNGSLCAAVPGDLKPDQLRLPPEDLLERIAGVAHELLGEAHANERLLVDGKLPLIGVATAWPCPVRGSKRPAGTILHRDWLRHDPLTLTGAVAAKLGFPPERCHALNDANAHALAVTFDRARALGAQRGHGSPQISLVIRVGGGLGAATIITAPGNARRLSFIDSALLGGARSLAGEIAHLPIDEATVEEVNAEATWYDGLAPLSTAWLCSCGKPMHLEALASGSAFVRRMEESGLDLSQFSVDMGYRFAPSDSSLRDQDDPRITAALEDMGRLVGRSLASPILMLDPHSITLTGSFAVAPVLDGILSERKIWKPVFGDALQITAWDGPDRKYIGVRGAALAVIRQHVYRMLEERLGAEPVADGLTLMR